MVWNKLMTRHVWQRIQLGPSPIAFFDSEKTENSDELPADAVIEPAPLVACNHQ